MFFHRRKFLRSELWPPLRTSWTRRPWMRSCRNKRWTASRAEELSVEAMLALYAAVRRHLGAVDLREQTYVG